MQKIDEVVDEAISPFERAASMKPVDIQCEKHGEQQVGFFWNGRECVKRKCPACQVDDEQERKRTEAEAAEQQRKEQKKRDIEAAIGRAGIPLRFQSRTFDNYVAHCDGAKKAHAMAKEYAGNFANYRANGGGLVMVGGVGTGKTHLAIAIAHEAIKQGYSPFFISIFGAIRHVKETWSKGSETSELQAIADFVEPDLLILDEVGVQFGSDAEKLILFEIFNRRYEEMKPTIVLSNESVDGLREFLGERVVDRMRENAPPVIRCNWESYRRSVGGEHA